MSNSLYVQESWSLDDLFSSFNDPKVGETINRTEEKIQKFERYRAQLTDALPEETFVQILNDYESLTKDLSRLGGYSSLRFSADTQDQEAQTYMARFRQLGAEAENRTLFFSLWWKELADDPAARLLDASGDYRYWLEALRLERPYTLTEPEEKIINLKDVNGPFALLTIMSTITDRYTYHMEVDGKEKELTRDELSVYFRNPDPALRAAAYQELFRVFKEDEPVLGQIYQYRIRDWRSEQVELRGFKSPISARNLNNDIPDQVVDTLLHVCRENASIFQDYFRLKARWLNVKKLRRYDIYAPVAKTEKEVAFGEAAELVLDSFAHFDPRVAELAERVLSEHHLDSEVRKGKRGGAFCATISPDLTPWVLQSYQGRPGDVATLAHELGHAIHSMLADHHTLFTQHASLPLAETASTFGEMLVIDRLLAEDPDPETERDLLFRQMDDNYATIMRQAYFAMFEREAHDEVAEGATIDEISEVYYQNVSDQFGDSLDMTDEFRHEWLMIPHIFQMPFYVYAYAFGQLLVLSLYQQYLDEGEAFKPRYLELLSAGGSDSPSNILRRAGIEFQSADFWQGGFDVLNSALKRLESLEIPER